MTQPVPSHRVMLLGSARLALGEASEIRLERKSAGLLAYLTIEGKTSRSQLAALLWPEAREDIARNNLAQTLRRLKQGAGGAALVAGQAQIRLADGLENDLRRLEERRCARPSSAAATSEKGGDAAQHGQLLAGFDYADCPDFDDWLQIVRGRLMNAHQGGLEALADQAEAANDPRTALAHTAALLACEPYCEAHHRRLMRLYWLAGDRNAALAAYRHCRQSLQHELGVEPSAETLALEHSILRGEAASTPLRPAFLCLPPSLLRPHRLVEREHLLARMETGWENGQAIFIEGHPGVGKTRLMQEFLGKRGRFYTFHGHTGDSDIPYASLARQLREMFKAFPALFLPDWVKEALAPILPELGLPAVLPENQNEPLRFYQALAAATQLAVDAGLCRVAFDDLHLQDLASLRACHFVCTQYGGRSDGLRMVFCFRSGELAPQAHDFISMELEKNRALLIRLDTLSEAGTAHLLAGIDPALAAMAGELHRHTGGNPLFSLETLKAMHDLKRLNGGPALTQSDILPMPRKVRHILEQRLARLSPHALQLARLSALADGPFQAERAETLLGLNAPAAAPLWAELAAAHIFIDWCFPHEFARRVVQESLPEPIRQRLQQTLADNTN